MRDFLHLFINGKPYHVSGSHAFMTLSDFLREELRLTGTKIVCREGDCGACSVLVGRPVGGKSPLVYRAIDSCIAFLYQLDGTHVVSVEGLGNTHHLSPVQEAMVRCHGSQCGYCTPGFVMTLHGLFEEYAEDPGSELSTDALRVGLSGNLCRCTGYVQIMEAAQSIDSKEAVRVNQLFPSGPIADSLQSADQEDVMLSANEDGLIKTLYLPRSLGQALTFKADNVDARVVTGATDVGVQYNHGYPTGATVLSLSNIADLAKVEVVDQNLMIGSSANWTEIISRTDPLYPEFANLLLRFGSPQIRNMGSIGGNLANASPIADCLPFLYVIDAKLALVSSEGRRVVDVKDFYQGYKQIDLRPSELIESVVCPLLAADERLKLCKVSKRRDMDISTFTAAMRLTIQQGTIMKASVALGGVGPTVIRASSCESVLIGAPFSIDVMRAAGVAAREEIRPITDVRGSDRYRGQLAENVFVKWFHELCNSDSEVSS